jgi:hypothetical protein
MRLAVSCSRPSQERQNRGSPRAVTIRKAGPIGTVEVPVELLGSSTERSTS